MLIDVTQNLIGFDGNALSEGGQMLTFRNVVAAVLDTVPAGEQPGKETSQRCVAMLEKLHAEPVVDFDLEESAFIADRVWRMVRPSVADRVAKILEGSRLDVSQNGHRQIEQITVE